MHTVLESGTDVECTTVDGCVIRVVEHFLLTASALERNPV